MVLIDLIQARQILNSRGEPTIEVEVTLNNSESVRASVPSGKSKSSYEAIELLDKDFANYFGRSVHHAVDNINKIIAPRLKKMAPEEQFKIDQILLELDGTPNKAHLGANATLAVSMVAARAAALVKEKPLYKHLNELFVKVDVKDQYGEPISLLGKLAQLNLPIPVCNLINGGKHGDTPIPIQEYCIFPVGIDKMTEKIRAAAEITWALRVLFQENGHDTDIGDEGGFAPELEDPNEPLKYLAEAVKKTGYHLKNKILYGLDVAGAKLPDQFLENAIKSYPMISIEDPYEQDDWKQFRQLKQNFADIYVIGDDITSMKLDRLYQAIKNEAINCVIIKPNQIGTITETLRFAKVAKHAGMELFASHRSGETNDTFIVDLAIGLGAKFLKAGAPVRGERVAKYNYLMEIALKFET